MKLSRKPFVQGKKEILKEASRDFWDMEWVDFEVREIGHEWIWS